MGRQTMRSLAAAATLLAGLLLGGTTPAVASAPVNGQLAFDRGENAVFISNPDGTAERRLSPDGVEGCCATWSPDGTMLAQLALTEDGQCCTGLYNADGTGFHVLARPSPAILPGCTTWSPDQTHLACEVGDETDPDFASGVFTIRLDGSHLTRLTTNPYPGGTDLKCDYSPDGSQIAFYRDDPTRKNGNSALFVADSDGTNVKRITPWGKLRNCASWSPDGKWLLFNNFHGQIWKVHPDGSNLQQIKLDTGESWYFAFEPDWSPDGNRFAFSMWNPALGQDDIYTSAADGTDIVQVTNTPEHEGNVSWGSNPVQQP
ncbi:TolB family protein [Micromonospora sp. IBHARD004]|uniref:TolB family protein n=1 Tax=Micromonospora sp. IBHARD004 TaxID=3457764 RepID=UPI0040593418